MKNALILLICLLSISTQAQQNIIHPQVFEIFETQSKVDCIIELNQPQNLIDQTRGLSKSEKANFVFNYLKGFAQNSQKDIIDFFENKDIDYQSFFIFNGFRSTLTQEDLLDLVDQFEVAAVTYNQPIKVSAVREELNEEERAELEWGLAKINTESVWDMGFKGEGITVAGQDTGYDYENPLIFPKYKGNDNGNVTHDFNWHDAIRELNPLHQDSTNEESHNPCGFNSPFPCDDHSHGSHTMGTMVGQDTANIIGVAPDAKWIACRNMERGYGTPATYTECYEWFLAPTDLNNENADPSLAPHVINNSWGCPEMEGCNIDNWDVMENVINNLVAAGTVVVVSAGNNGSQNCGSIMNPSSIFENAFTVGASRENDTIAGFSSIGPVTVDGSLRMKPDVVAPGVGIRSITLNNEFGTWNGTSMAGPHVAGAIALLIQAKPELSGDVEMIQEILKATAVKGYGEIECEGMDASSSPNFVYGHGRIDLLAAVNMALGISSIKDEKQNLFVNVFPNPSNGYFEFEFIESTNKKVDISIFNHLGKLVHSQKNTAGKIVINLSHVPEGIYYFTLDAEGQIGKGKILKI